MDDSPTPIIVPHTPPTRLTVMGYHRRLDSFPTDDIDDGFGSVADDASITSGMTPSFSMGAFPVFLIQESPAQSGLGGLVPQFPESPESTFGFQSPPKRTAPGCQQTWQVNEPESGAKKLSEGIDYFSADQAFQTPKRAPIHTIVDRGQARGDMGRKLSLEKAGADFGRRLQCEDDETLVDHYDVTVAEKNLHPMALRYSSSTSTSLGSPLSDTFSPRSASYSMSTDSSLRSPCKASITGCSEEADDFPTEVGGPVSLDLEEPPLSMQTSSTAVLELKPVPLRSQADISIGGLSESANPFVANSHIHSYLTLEPAVGSFSDTDTVQPVAQAAVPASMRESYGQLGRAKSHSHLHPLPLSRIQIQRDPSDSSVIQSDGRRSVSSPVGSTQPDMNHRRAFSGTGESIRSLPVTTGSIPGRFRSCSINSSVHRDALTTSNNLIEQAARSRSRSNSASGTVPYAPSRGLSSAFVASKTTLNSSHGQRTLSSSKSKDSFQSKFANLPGYVTFLRDITIELWIDQEGFRAVRPRFELRRYTPGQQAPIGSGIRMKRKATPSIGSSTGSPVPMGGDKLSCFVAPSPSPIRQLDPLSQSGSGASLSSSAASVSPTALLFPPQVQSAFEILDRPIKSQFLENWGMAEFTMTKREGCNFHHGVVDSEPVLRRLTVNDVEDRDYLSREASLCIKSNGVYTAKGTEDRGRFEWRLEYLVEDRRGSSGAVIHGEKTLTPLSFTCAPELLIPEQGRKVGLLHVMKKSVTPKIHSSKLDPPMIPTTPGRGHGNDTPVSTPSSSGPTGSNKLEVLCRMARPSSAKSRPVTPKRAYPHAYSPSNTPVRQAQSTDEHGRRRAASYSANRPDVRKLLGKPEEN